MMMVCPRLLGLNAKRTPTLSRAGRKYVQAESKRDIEGKAGKYR